MIKKHTDEFSVRENEKRRKTRFAKKLHKFEFKYYMRREPRRSIAERVKAENRKLRHSFRPAQEILQTGYKNSRFTVIG